MKKSIKVLIEKLEENDNGLLKGGFASIKGGFRPISDGLFRTNSNGCTNSGSCEGATNTSGCTNSGSCG